MARIYSSRVLIDPNLLSTVGRATEDRIRMENERRRNVLSPVVKLLSNTGSEIDKYRSAESEEEKQRKRYADVAWQSSDEQMRDPMYRAALDEYARTGSAAPLSQYMLGKETREANRLERERAAAEKAALDRKEFELSKAENLPRFQEAMRKYNEEMSKPAPDFALADQYMAEADAINKRYGFDARELDKIAESNKRTAEKRIEAARIASEEKELEEMGARNLKTLQDAEEVDRQMRVAEFLVTLPSTPKNDTEKQEIIKKITGNPDMTKEEKTAELKRLVGVSTDADAIRKAINNAIANAAAQNTTESIAEQKELKAILVKQSKGIPLSTREQQLVEKYSDTGAKPTPKPNPSTPKPTPKPNPKPTPETPELARIRDKQDKGIPLSSRERKILNEAGGK